MSQTLIFFNILQSKCKEYAANRRKYDSTTATWIKGTSLAEALMLTVPNQVKAQAVLLTNSSIPLVLLLYISQRMGSCLLMIFIMTAPFEELSLCHKREYCKWTQFLSFSPAHSWIKNIPLSYTCSFNSFTLFSGSSHCREKSLQQVGSKMTRFLLGEMSSNGSCSPSDMPPLENTVLWQLFLSHPGVFETVGSLS